MSHNKHAQSRPLSPSEYLFWLLDQANPMNHVEIAELSGALDLQRLQQALDELQQLHPLLRCRVVRRFNKAVFEPLDAPAPIPVQKLPSTAQHEAIEQQLDTPFAIASYPLIRCLWFCNDTPHSVIALVFHHVIADASAGAALLADLLKRATRPNPTTTLHSPVDTLPSLDAMYPAHVKGLSGLQRAAGYLFSAGLDWIRNGFPHRLPGFTPVSAQKRQLQVLPLVFEKDFSTALLNRCRQEQTSLHGALGAALMLALYAEFPPHRAATLSLVSPVSLRPFLARPIPANALGNFIGDLFYLHRVDAHTNPWDLARDFRASLHRRIERGEAHAVWPALPPRFLFPPSPLGAWAINRLMFIHPASCMLTNAGKFADLHLPGITVNALSFCMSPIGRDSLALCAASFHGRLRLHLVHAQKALSTAAGQRIAAKLHQILLGLVPPVT